MQLSGKVSVKSTNKFSIITLNDYDFDTENVSKMSDECNSNVNQMSDECNSNVTPTLYKKENNNIIKQETAHTREGDVVENRSDNDVKNSFMEGFERFWRLYPKKTAKQNALKAWIRLKPDDELTEIILSALERHKNTGQWQKDNGQFIPYPATWLPQTACNTAARSCNSPPRRSSIDTKKVVERIRARYRAGGDIPS